MVSLVVSVSYLWSVCNAILAFGLRVIVYYGWGVLVVLVSVCYMNVKCLICSLYY